MEQYKLKEMRENNFYSLTKKDSNEVDLVKCIENSCTFYKVITKDNVEKHLPKNIHFREIFLIENISVLERMNALLKEKQLEVLPVLYLGLGDYKHGYYSNSHYIGGYFSLVEENEKDKFIKQIKEFQNKKVKEVDFKQFYEKFNAFFEVNNLFKKVGKKVSLTEEQKNKIVFG